MGNNKLADKMTEYIRIEIELDAKKLGMATGQVMLMVNEIAKHPEFGVKMRVMGDITGALKEHLDKNGIAHKFRFGD